jgi:hypothetical protein
MTKRIDKVSRVIGAPPATIYRALLDAAACSRRRRRPSTATLR